MNHCRSAYLLLAGCSFLPACQIPDGSSAEPKATQPGEYQPLTPLYIDPLFADRAPANVAVLAIRDTVGMTPEVKANLRSFVYTAMIGKGYATLNPEFVDQREREQGVKPNADLTLLKGTFPAEGYLVCSFSVLDTKIYQETKQVVVQGRVTLYRSGTGSTMFDWEPRRQVKLSVEAGSIKPSQTIEEAAAERFLAMCLEQLPARPARP